MAIKGKAKAARKDDVEGAHLGGRERRRGKKESFLEEESELRGCDVCLPKEEKKVPKKSASANIEKSIV